MSSNSISTLEELREIYGPWRPESMAVLCELPSLDAHHQNFIALSPLLLLASVDAKGLPDVSPRGDLPGFVAAPDEHTLIIPDRPGNKKILTLSNIVENPNVAIIFFVPGRTDSLRVTGKAGITTDPARLTPLAVEGKVPKTAIVVAVEKAWFHCGKALLRSQIWSSEAQVAPGAMPTLGTMLADQIAGLNAVDADRQLESAIKTKLWGEPDS